MAGIREEFRNQLDHISLYVEYLDTLRQPDADYCADILSSIIQHALHGRHFDLVLLSDDNALDFVLQHRGDLFANSAVVFCGINNFRPALLSGFKDITGIAESPSYLETIATALKLHPGARQIVVVGGVRSLANLENRTMLGSALTRNPFYPPVQFVFWGDLPAEELTSRLEDLPPDSLVLVNGSVATGAGESLSYREEMRIISKACRRPIYSLWDTMLGEGIVGGKLVSGKQQGRLAARVALRILQGENPNRIPVTFGPNRYMFDARQLKKFGLSVRSLPAGSVVIHRAAPFYALSEGQLWVGMAVLTVLSLLLFFNILVRRRTQKRLYAEKEQVALLLRSAAEAIYGIDLQGRCTFCNPAALRMLGFRQEADLLHNNIHELIHHSRRDRTPYPVEECRVCAAYLHGENLHVEDEFFWRADGIGFPVEYWSYPIRKGDRTVGAVVTFLDITKRKEAEKKREEAVQELNAFVYTVSHDLRSPLSGIIGFADFLQQSASSILDENGRTALNEIVSQGDRMAAMLEDLLSLAKVGKLPTPAQAVDLNEVVAKVLGGLRRQIDATGLTVQTTSLPCARVPETLLSQVFSNLIGNAVRYAGEKGGPIEIAGKRNKTMVRFSIRDHGPGIPAQERQQVFDVFYRGSTAKRIPGTGIGLATVQKIARLYAGRVWIEDTPGGGATFTVELVDAPTEA